ncbi:MAG: cupin domain-containing protein [Crocinitomicaceae bacterium]|nr:cupin domain-containing protein [Crocinitomicaceae bacterium]
MESKSNNSTPQRPDGERALNANFIQMDLNKYMEQIKSEAKWETGEMNSITLFKSEAMRIVLIGLHKDAVLKTHTAKATISVQVVEGNIQFQAADAVAHLTKGQMITLQPNIPHGAIANEESFFLLTLALN